MEEAEGGREGEALFEGFGRNVPSVEVCGGGGEGGYDCQEAEDLRRGG